MLRMQLLGHSSGKDEMKRYLREAGIVEVIDVSVADRESRYETEAAREAERLLELTEGAIAFLEQYAEKKPLFERLAAGPIRITRDDAEKLSRKIHVEEISHSCT